MSCQARHTAPPLLLGLFRGWLVVRRGEQADGGDCRTRSSSTRRTCLIQAGELVASRSIVAGHAGNWPCSTRNAGVAAVLSALNGATLAQLATHGVLSAHNQLFSRLRFADGPVLVLRH
jgi:hypothetical protein